jgi:hypothetical protein
MAVGLALEPVKIVQAPMFERWDRRHGSLAKSPLFGDGAHEFEYLGGFGFAPLRIRARIRGHVFDREAVPTERVIVVFGTPDEVE